MKNKLLSIISDLVEFRTTADNREVMAACFDYIDKKLAFFPFIKKEYEKNGVKSVVWLTKDTLRPEIALLAHIDVVPAPEELFKVKVEGGKAKGRGVSDMKFAVASFIVALENIFKKEGKLPSLAVMITVDEETGGHDGVEYLIKEIGFQPKLAIVPDGGDNYKIVEKAKGVFHLKLTSRGKACHGSRPWEGENAIDKMVENIRRIRAAFPQPPKEVWQTTANLGKIMGGKATNQVCDLVELSVDFRYTEEFNKESLLAEIKKLCPEAEIGEISHGNNFLIDKEDPAIAKWESLLKEVGASDIFVNEHGASDGRYLSEIGIPTIVSKPVGGKIHSVDEWIDLNSVADFTKILEKFIIDFPRD